MHVCSYLMSSIIIMFCFSAHVCIHRCPSICLYVGVVVVVVVFIFVIVVLVFVSVVVIILAVLVVFVVFVLPFVCVDANVRPRNVG